MRKAWLIAVREYRAAVRTKSFLISLVCMPLLMLGGVGVPALLDSMGGKRAQRFAVIDRTPGQGLARALAAAGERRNARAGQQAQAEYRIEVVTPSAATPDAILEQRLELSEQVRQDQLAGFLEIGAEVLAPPAGPVDSDAPSERMIRYQAGSPTQDTFARWAERELNEAIVAERCANQGINRTTAEAIARHVPLRISGLVRRNPSTGALEEISNEARLAMIVVPVVLTVLLFLIVMVGATPLMHSVLEEKMQRIAEVLLGSVTPFELMLGKLVGMMGVSLTLATVYLLGSYWAVHYYGFAEYLPPSLIAWFLLYLALAVLMYGSLFIAIGAACTDAKESQTLLLPVTMLMAFPMFTMRLIIQEPNSPLAVGISLFPFATPLVMVLRLGLPPGVPWWQPVLGVIEVLATSMLCVYVAGRIFRVGILMQGKGAKLSDLARWVVRG